MGLQYAIIGITPVGSPCARQIPSSIPTPNGDVGLDNAINFLTHEVSLTLLFMPPFLKKN